ncbi:hypothetical protein VW37_003929 [Salmonella enterica subsp. houtenae serovar 51:z4,z23:-]|nr:hypothetical protein [Salmonella enterica subsp. houtenae]ECF6027251.1 hypothetical protein [Salmonella enterica subsp. houtenae]ECJ2497982.1 hypothetical protein [Salmonella enterica subsp. houtenae]ECT3984021.1 hypothetical protein [Salmonella enterica subsp. houtenae serovar 53:z4,z23:-]EGI6181503.1 hypothetical protein [Salmonella enterica subsp. houtenae serovar 51:z4,z23:-]
MSRSASPVRAWAGGIVCKKSQLKNFSDMKTAGGCGVVRFRSIRHFYIYMWKDLQLQLILK